MLNTYEQRSKLKLAATVITILVVAGLVLVVDHLRTDKDFDDAPAASSSVTPDISSGTSSAGSASSNNGTIPTSTNATSAASYKDGSYSATSTYYVPHGKEEIQVGLTLKDGTVTDVSVQNSESNRDSAQYQQDFTAGYKSHVVGKKISGLKLGIIAGASDTTDGFNDALNQIATKAQS